MRLGDDDLARLRAALAGRPPGEFHLPEIWGEDWGRLWIGERVQAGHAFLDAVRAGRLAGVEDTGRKAGGGRVYAWRGG
ncbi:DUF1413 domain-containing protein [Albimonas pacifica]|uniref:DUF1413 domain-containing protein n=1 Tax=Albimonas pacifica TaxID=1114924 RepID=A0A1I3IER5_9RHOB|nr:DUF1413 domain-containing protein [Albimonas pacifica]SFI46380.1 protein of unknown function [Albimonas pacifica]